MNLLPHWVLTDKFPAFFDSESKTAIEQTARVYGAMQELIKEYNKFADSVNTHIVDFENAIKKDYEIFTTELRQEFQDFIDIIDLKVTEQDTKIDDAVKYLKDELHKTIRLLFNEMYESGEISDIILEVFDNVKERLDNLEMFVTPEMFGALGDGIADDTNAFLECIAYAKEKNLNIEAGNKTYLINQPLIIDYSGSINIAGTINYLGNDFAIEIKSPRVDLYIKSIISESGGIVVCDANGLIYFCDIKVNYINAKTIGVKLDSQINGIQDTFIDCLDIITPHDDESTKAIYLDCANDNHIGECFFKNAKLGGYYGVYIDGHESADITGVSFENFSIEGDSLGAYNGIYLKNAHCCDFRDFRSQEVTEGDQLIMEGKCYGNLFAFDLMFLDKISCENVSEISSPNILRGCIRNNMTQQLVVINGTAYLKKAGAISSRDFSPVQLGVTSENSPAKVQYKNGFYNTFILNNNCEIILDKDNFINGFSVVVQTAEHGTIKDTSGEIIVDLSAQKFYKNRVLKISAVDVKLTNPNMRKWLVEDIRKSDEVYTTNGLTFADGVSYISGGFFRLGKATVVNLRVKAEKQISAGTSVVLGLPSTIVSTNSIAFSTNRINVSAFYNIASNSIQVSEDFNDEVIFSGVYI